MAVGGAVVQYRGVIPGGLVLDTKTGVITGTPTQVAPEAKYTITASNYRGEDTFELIITVIDIPPIFQGYTTVPAEYELGARIDRNMPIIKGGAAVSFSGSLPPGLILNTKTGVINGTPSHVSARQKYQITCFNSGGKDTFDLPMAIIDVPPQFYGAGYTMSPAEYVKFEVISNNRPRVKANGKMHYTVDPPLPTGLEMDTENGVITGQPKTTCVQTVYKVTATNSGGSDIVDLRITVHENALLQMLAIAENEQQAKAESEELRGGK